jgi:hypothetical protein
MYIGSSGGKGRCTRIRASEAEYLISRVDQLSDDCGTYEACGACDENTHILYLLNIGPFDFRTYAAGIDRLPCSG